MSDSPSETILPGTGGPYPLNITFTNRGQRFAVRAEEPNGFLLPITNEGLDLPLGTRRIKIGTPPQGPGDRNAIWNLHMFPDRVKLLCRGGTAFEYSNRGGSELIVPKLQNQLPLVGGNGDEWVLRATTINRITYKIQSTRTGKYWSVPKNSRRRGNTAADVIQLQPESGNFIQDFQLDLVSFDGINDNRGRNH
ncbi:hypothetical protein Dda_5210 [Drechslerella dactyloides]|uniref:Uncharacterized protein n=1 Tax=Drechslerella dactyloides TaxID=74499 RepID=A0AAD6IVU7_DREDA|nr:hypothetical protein Dda_5210 [Drechslerella dactyloides]